MSTDYKGYVPECISVYRLMGLGEERVKKILVVDACKCHLPLRLEKGLIFPGISHRSYDFSEHFKVTERCYDHLSEGTFTENVYQYEATGNKDVIYSEQVPDFLKFCSSRWNNYIKSFAGRVGEMRRALGEAYDKMAEVYIISAGFAHDNPNRADQLEVTLADRLERRWPAQDLTEPYTRFASWKRLMSEIIMQGLPEEKFQAPTLETLAVEYLRNHK